MEEGKISYQKAADQFLVLQYENNWNASMYLVYKLARELVGEAKKICRSAGLKGMDAQDVLVSTWFYYAGLRSVDSIQSDQRTHLLHEFFDFVSYPAEHRVVVETAISALSEGNNAENRLQQIISDAIYSYLARPGFTDNITLLDDAINGRARTDDRELHILKHYRELFINTRYYTPYALENFAVSRAKNLQLLEKRIRKLEDTLQTVTKDNSNFAQKNAMTGRETEDLFKLAFRNFNHLVSVADAKASLLIKVNSLIITVMLAFVIGKAERNLTFLWPAVFLISVSSLTIFLSILASRPQKSKLVEDKLGHSYQRFFFGSFDLIDRNFRYANWEDYLSQLTEYLNSPRDKIYRELYKETYNVRKVLSKKFSYLSAAYWVFIGGLIVSVAAFIITIRE